MGKEVSHYDPHASPLSEEHGTVEAEQTEAFLDAINLRARSDFDLNLAKSMQSVLGQAIKMVEEGELDADKAMPGGASSLPLYTEGVLGKSRYLLLEEARNRKEIYREPATGDISRPNSLYPFDTQSALSAAQATQEVRDKLQAIAQGHTEPFTTQEKALPNEGEGGIDDRVARGLSPLRVFFVGGAPIGMTVAGGMLLLASAVTTPVRPNPYIAIAIFIAGIGLILTAVVALRERRESL